VTIEQKPELNRFVDPSIPLTWRYRWEQYRRLLPLILFCSVCLLDQALLHAWLADQMFLGVFVKIAVCGLAISLVLFLGLEFGIRSRHRSKRVIRIEDKGIYLKPSKRQLIRWKEVSAWLAEPIPQEPELSKLTVLLSQSKKPQKTAWSMVLDKSQMRTMFAELELRKNIPPANFQIDILNEPSLPESRTRFSMAGLCLYLFGFYLLLHGGPLLLSGLTHGHSHGDSGGSKFTSAEIEKLARFFQAHFSSKAEVRHFFIVAGSVLTGLGLVFMVWGWLLMKRLRKQP
jgi:hypothetical protein